MKSFFASFLAVAAATALPAAFPVMDAMGHIEAEDGSYAADGLSIPKDFKVELMYVTPNATAQGQWVAITFDTKGRLLAAGYDSDQLFRLTLPDVGKGDRVTIETLNGTKTGAAEGLLVAYNSLYMNVNRASQLRAGLYRLTDTNNDDKYDKTEVLRNVQGAGQDHGTHALRLGPDNRIYLLNGNQTMPTVYQSSRVPFNWAEDVLTTRIQTGFMNSAFGDFSNEGYVVSLDKDGKAFDLFAMGSRNPVDFAFNKDGELFQYDADMEWDMGDPWYRPTQVQHVTSGVDFGFRNGSRKHPQYYIDYAAPVAAIGAGSPVGTTFGTKAKFPARYQDAYFIADWSYGNLYATMIEPQGSSYTGEVTAFMSGKPFSVTGVAVNPNDGSLVVATGGRAQTVLYRVTYTGRESVAPTAPDTHFAADRKLRQSMEAFHGKKDPKAVAAVWPHLGDHDARVRLAARIALEWQDVTQWQNLALNERDPRKSISAIVALARASTGLVDDYSRKPSDPLPDKALQKRMIDALDQIDMAPLPYQDKLDLLRAYSLTFIRLGKPDEATREKMIAKFDPMLPSRQRELNWELADMLAYLDAPTAPTKILALIRTAPAAAPFFGWREWINPELRTLGSPGASGPPGASNYFLAKQEDQIYYAQLLRVVKNGWTMPLREEYMKWFITDASTYRGGNEFNSSNAVIRADAISQLPPDAAEALKAITEAPVPAGRGGGGGRGGAGGGAGGGRGGAAAPAAPIANPAGAQF